MSDFSEILFGRCLCGACSFSLIGPANWVGHCHCQSCRKATASAFTTWVGQENGRWHIEADRLVTFSSSVGVMRGFCGFCGSQIFYESDRFPNERHFYAALLDKPDLRQPTAHYHRDEILSWIHLCDDLADG